MQQIDNSVRVNSRCKRDYSFSHCSRSVLIESGANYNLQSTIQNGHLGAFVNPSNDTSSSAHIFSQLYQSGQLLNPVVGFRFDPRDPKITIGALDPADYDGNLNWVEINAPNESFDSLNTFSIDGLKGYNDSFIPIGNNVTASLDSRTYYDLPVSSSSSDFLAHASQLQTQ